MQHLTRSVAPLISQVLLLGIFSSNPHGWHCPIVSAQMTSEIWLRGGVIVPCLGGFTGPNPVSTSAATVSTAARPSTLDDLLALSVPSAGAEQAAFPPVTAAPPALTLDPRPSLTPAAFQSSWGSLQPAANFTHQLPPSALAAIEADNHQVPDFGLLFLIKCCFADAPHVCSAADALSAYLGDLMRP